MLVFYNINNNSFSTFSEDEIKNGAKPIFIEVVDPTSEETEFISNIFNINISKNNLVAPIKIRNFYYHNRGEVQVKLNVLTDTNGLQNITAILTPKILIIVRSSAIYSIKEYLEYIISNGDDSNFTPIKIFMHGLESRMSYIDTSLERIDNALDEISQAIFFSQNYNEKKDPCKEINLNQYVDQIGKNGYLVSNNHGSLMSIHQALSFIRKSKLFTLSDTELDLINSLGEELSALEEQVSFLTDKLNFLLSICLGMIGNEQNSINKVLSIAALVFLPPTIIASIYGMNFDYMPELKWHYGFTYAILVIIISATFPYLFCKFKKWV